jgi:hypothetical protein
MRKLITISLFALALCLPVAAQDKITTEGLTVARTVSLNPVVWTWTKASSPAPQQQDSIEVTVKLPGNAAKRQATCEKYARAYGWSTTIAVTVGGVTTTMPNSESACDFLERHLEEHVQTVVASVDANAKAEDERKKEADKVRSELPTKRKKPAQPEAAGERKN